MKQELERQKEKMEYIIAEVLRDCSDTIKKMEKRNLQASIKERRRSSQLSIKDLNLLYVRDNKKEMTFRCPSNESIKNSRSFSSFTLEPHIQQDRLKGIDFQESFKEFPHSQSKQSLLSGVSQKSGTSKCCKCNCNKKFKRNSKVDKSKSFMGQLSRIKS